MKIQRLTRVKLTLGAFVRLVSVFLDLHGAEEQDLFVKAISRNLIFKMCQVRARDALPHALTRGGLRLFVKCRSTAPMLEQTSFFAHFRLNLT